MISKYILTFSIGITFSLASMAFFNMMQMPGQMMQMGQQLVAPQPQDQPCNCTCDLAKK